MLLEIALIAALTILNGLLAMSELAIVSARPVRLKVLAAKKTPGARTAIALADDPGRFLSTVQIGITLVGVLNGALSGATLGQRLAAWLLGQGVDAALAGPLGVGLVVVVITYFSLIIGELVPKRIALRNPEQIAALVARPLQVLSVLTTPLVWFLDISGRLVLFVLGQHEKATDIVTEEEVHSLIAEAETAGVIESDERSMISGVMRFADRSAQDLMTPRSDVEIIRLADTADAIRAQILASKHARLPVSRGAAGAVIGAILTREVMPVLVRGDNFRPEDFVHDVPVIPVNLDALSVLRAIRSSIVHLALVFDEDGHFKGIVTTGDILEAIAGTFKEEGDDTPAFMERADGSFLVEGWMPVDEFADAVGIVIPRPTGFETIAGLVLSELKRMPAIGEKVALGDWAFEVVDIDGRRVDKVLVSRLPQQQAVKLDHTD